MENYQLDPIVKERFLELPKGIQDIITESNWQEKIRVIVQKHNIRIDQGAAIEHEIFLVMLGFDSPDKFVRNIMNEAQLSQDIAEEIEREVGTMIFDPLKEILMSETTGSTEIEENNSVPEAETTTQTSTPSIIEKDAPESREEILRQIQDEDAETEDDIVADNLASPTTTGPVSQEMGELKKQINDPYREPLE